MFYKYIVSVLALCSTLALHSQELPYNFQVVTGFTYIPLTNADTLDTNGPWDHPTASIPIGFDFPFFGEMADSIFLNGFTGPYLMSSGAQSPMWIPYGADLTDRGFGTSTSQSPILYRVDHEAPNRIFKMEWQNAGFFKEQFLGIDESFVNFQIWLYEASGAIEYCYGPNNIVAENQVFTSSHSGPYIGFIGDQDLTTGTTVSPWIFQDDPLNPEIMLFENFNASTTALSSTPPANTIYQFIVADVSAVNEEELIAGVQVYPNPVGDQLQLKLDLEEAPDQLEVRLFNTLGQQVYYQSLGQQSEGQISIDMAKLPKGMYSVQLRDGKAQLTKSIVRT